MKLLLALLSVGSLCAQMFPFPGPGRPGSGGAAGLAVDASTPAAVTAASTTLTTASFTPPNGAVLYIFVGLNSDTSLTTRQNSVASITDNRGTHLTYTQVAQYGTELGADSLAYLYTAIVTSSAAMTVSVTQTATDTTTNYAELRVLVVTGADTSSATAPVGAKGGARGRTTNVTGAAAQYTSTRNGSWGWLLYSDWSASAIPTAGSGQTVDSAYTTTGQITYATIKQNSTTATSGTTVTMSTTAPTSGLTLSYIYFEMMPQ